jgi:hypothetical protein
VRDGNYAALSRHWRGVIADVDVGRIDYVREFGMDVGGFEVHEIAKARRKRPWERVRGYRRVTLLTRDGSLEWRLRTRDFGEAIDRIGLAPRQ